jgi:hypothetical protein
LRREEYDDGAENDEGDGAGRSGRPLMVERNGRQTVEIRIASRSWAFGAVELERKCRT